MATAKQIAANRRNSQKSTGAKSVETKAIVSQNPIRHGLCGRFCVLDCEDPQKFDDLLTQFRRDEKPVGSVEEELVFKMARHTWLSNRAIRLQEACFIVEPLDPPEQIDTGADAVSVRTDLERYIRYQVQNDRAYQRASQELIQRRKERLLQEIGFARKKHAEAKENRTEAAEIRKIEKHQIAVAAANIRKQRDEMRFGKEIADALPPNFDFNSLNSFFAAAAPSAPSPITTNG